MYQIHPLLALATNQQLVTLLCWSALTIAWSLICWDNKPVIDGIKQMYVLFISNSHFVRFSHSNQALTGPNPNYYSFKDKYKPIYPSSFLAIMMNFLNVPNQIRSKKIHSFFLLFFFFFSQFLKKSIRNYLLSRFLILFYSFFFPKNLRKRNG